MKRILVGLDGSEQANRALEIAIELSRGMEAELLAVCAVAPTMMASEFGAELQGYLEARERGALVVVSGAVARAEREGVAARGLVVTGPADVVLSRIAESEQADLVVVGTHGRGAVGRLIAGSVSDRLVHLCPRPVLVAR
jgi:nucleotide-binding universal stress UspA family protein